LSLAALERSVELLANVVERVDGNPEMLSRL
jgi:hypothetical protein